MKYLRKYENSGFDTDFAIIKIREHFSEEEVVPFFSPSEPITTL